MKRRKKKQGFYKKSDNFVVEVERMRSIGKKKEAKKKEEKI